MRLYLALLLASLCLACSPPREDESTALRLGYFPRLTHAPALTGVESGRFERALGDVQLSAHAFEFGNAAMEAIFAREIDVAYLGPNPAINGFMRSRGAVRIIAGAAAGGAALIVRDAAGIASPKDLAHKRIATPQIASTQDIALRRYLRKHGLRSALDGGNVEVLPLSTPFILSLFSQGEIDGAWVSEPVAAQLLALAGARVFVDEKDEWPNGVYPATLVVVRKAYLDAHPARVQAFLQAHKHEVAFARNDSDAALSLSLAAMKDRAGREIPTAIGEAAWARIQLTSDLMADTLPRLAEDARAERFLPEGSLDGLVVTP
ncbi:MAG TPA: ABC transporter substrate-binding protein [Polyangiaceae bacterium]|nr:ABC transporter substrate-binding protein [Polyangiaceae bacterium]